MAMQQTNLYGTFLKVTQLTMDSMKGQGGIQMLLTAEQEAQQIVAGARNCKTPMYIDFQGVINCNSILLSSVLPLSSFLSQ